MDEPRLTDEEFRALIKRVQNGTMWINEHGGFNQVRHGRVFDLQRHGPPFTEVEEAIVLWNQLWNQMSDEANRRSRSGYQPEQNENFVWPKEGFLGGGKMPNEDPDDYIKRMRELAFPKKKGGRKKNDTNRQDTNLVRTTSPLFKGDTDA